MQQVFAAIDWFLNTSADYQAQEPTRLSEFLALIQREMEACQEVEVKEQLEARKVRLEQLNSR